MAEGSGHSLGWIFILVALTQSSSPSFVRVNWTQVGDLKQTKARSPGYGTLTRWRGQKLVSSQETV